MGLNYSINLFFDASRLEDALLAAAEFAVPHGDPCQVRVPSGRVLSLPFTNDFGTERGEIRAGGIHVSFSTVLRFADDGVLGPYFDRVIGSPRQSSDLVEIGCIDLGVHLGHRFVELAFTAVASDMSILFRESPSIQHRLLKVLHDAGGIAGVMYIESDEFPVLSDPTKKIRIDRSDYLDDDYDPESDPSDYDVDGFTADLLTKYNQVLPI